MTIAEELELSFYQKVADIQADHGISLVQDKRTGKFYVRKELRVYNPQIYNYLMHHPIAHTPKILLAVEDGKVLTVIEEYIPGDTLQELLDKSGTLPEGQVVDLMIGLCDIISGFHSCTPAIVNRDLKPSNIKITPDGVVKLLDLNAAKWSDEASAKDTVLLGTQGYAAPEQYGFGPSSVLTDIYAMGVLMNVMRTGKLPNEKMADGALSPVIRKAVELSPGNRYQSVEQLQQVLKQLRGEPMKPLKPQWRKYLPPGFRRGNLIYGIFGACGYMLVLYMGLSMQIVDAGPLELWLNRISFILAGLGAILFNNNYLGICKYFSLAHSKKTWVRWLGKILVDLVLLVFWALVTSILSQLLHP